MLEGLVQEQGLQRGLQVLSHVFQHHREAELHGVLQGTHVVRVSEVDDLHVVRLFHLFDPLVGLVLGIDEKGPPPGVRDNNGIVDGELVVGQSRDAPLSDLDRVAETLLQGENIAARDTPLLALGGPLLRETLPEGHGEDSQVGDESSGNQNVSQNVLLLLREALSGLAPPLPLSAQSTDQSLRSLELLRADLDLVLEPLLLGDGLLKLVLQQGQLILELLELGLLDLQAGHDLAVLGFGLGEGLLLWRDNLRDSVVRVDRKDPLTQTLRSGRSLGGVRGGEVRVARVLAPHGVNDLGRNVVLVVGLQPIDESLVTQKTLTWVPVVLYLLTASRGVGDSRWLDIHADANGLKNELDRCWGVLEVLDEVDVGRLDGVEGGHGGLKGGNGLRESLLALHLDGVGLVSLALGLGHLPVHHRCLGLHNLRLLHLNSLHELFCLLDSSLQVWL